MTIFEFKFIIVAVLVVVCIAAVFTTFAVILTKSKKHQNDNIQHQLSVLESQYRSGAISIEQYMAKKQYLTSQLK